jgi:hypothetical protein
MIDRPLDAISYADLEALVRSDRGEGRTLDFKVALSTGDHKGTRDFLADVTAFANTDGGDIVIGIAEDDNGNAGSIVGIARDGLDERLRGLEDQLRTLVDPRVPDFRTHIVDCPDGRVVVVMRVGSSLIAPHRVAFDKSSRFYRRASRANFEMSTAEIRQAFAAAADMPKQLRDLHRRAVTITDGTDMPVRLLDRPAAILTIAPLAVLREPRDIAVTCDYAVFPPRVGHPNFVVGLDGVIVHAPVEEAARGTRAWSINQRRGYVDFAWTLGHEKDGTRFVWPANLEDHLFGTARSTLARLGTYGIGGPWTAMVSVKGLHGYQLYLDDDQLSASAWQDSAFLGDIIDDRLSEETFLPILEGFWRLFGENRADYRG